MLISEKLFITIAIIQYSINFQDSLWSLEDFCIYCPLLEVSMLDRRVAGKVSGVAITIGEISNKNKTENGRSHDIHITPHSHAAFVAKLCLLFTR